jgi:hypothetical protein
MVIGGRFKGCLSFMDFFVYMDGHPQATVVLFPCSLITQGVKEATMGITVCLLLCLVVCFLAPQSVARGGSVAYMVYLPGVWLQLS